MRWKIEHTLSYRYSRPVPLDPQTIRLRPRPGIRQQILRSDLTIFPSPSFITNFTDIENNILTTAWFQGNYEEMQILARSDVEVSDCNPYDFILMEPSLNGLPLVYREPVSSLLKEYVTSRKEASQTLNDFLKPILVQAKYETVPFLTGLVVNIFDRLKRAERKSGDPWDPVKTLKNGKGSCRDFAWLYVAACRSLGIAARFVSGYYVPPEPQEKPELHAWAEVFLPGAGWLGLDPSLGMAVSASHIAVAASYDPTLTLPTTGKFWGKDAKSVLNTSITVDSLTL